MELPKKKSAEAFVKAIRNNTRRIFITQQKILIVMEALRAEISITKSYADKKTEKLQIVIMLQSQDSEMYKHFGKLSTENWLLAYAENFMNSNTYIQYQENATPAFLLFNKAGNLIDRWVGSAVHQQKLEQYFGKL